jgi:hypothetical protein
MQSLNPSTAQSRRVVAAAIAAAAVIASLAAGSAGAGHAPAHQAPSASAADGAQQLAARSGRVKQRRRGRAPIASATGRKVG